MNTVPPFTRRTSSTSQYRSPQRRRTPEAPAVFLTLSSFPFPPGYGYLVREKPEAKGKAYDPDNYDWLYMLVESVEIPERSFIRASFDNGGDTLEKLCKEAVDGIIRKGWTAQEAADYVGKWAVEMTREYFNTKLSPAKSATTLRTTTQYQPLFDSGRLYNSITYRVEGGGAQ